MNTKQYKYKLWLLKWKCKKFYWKIESKFRNFACRYIKPNEICTECNHKQLHHYCDDEGWWGCSANGYGCNCGNNIGR